MSQAVSGRELAPANVTGEVVRGARRLKSPTPAPVAKATPCEEDPMFKSKKTLGLAATALITGSACVSGPELRPPPPADCPPGHEETRKRFDFAVSHDVKGLWVLPYADTMDNRWVPASQGPMRVKALSQWRKLPEGSVLVGESFIGKNLFYGRFTQVQLPDGETLPVCMEVAHGDHSEKPGLPMDPERTTDHPLMFTVLNVKVVDRFH
jgi:serine/threonine-protein kinase